MRVVPMCSACSEARLHATQEPTCALAYLRICPSTTFRLSKLRFVVHCCALPESLHRISTCAAGRAKVAPGYTDASSASRKVIERLHSVFWHAAHAARCRRGTTLRRHFDFAGVQGTGYGRSSNVQRFTALRT